MFNFHRAPASSRPHEDAASAAAGGIPPIDAGTATITQTATFAFG